MGYTPHSAHPVNHTKNEAGDSYENEGDAFENVESDTLSTQKCCRLQVMWSS